MKFTLCKTYEVYIVLRRDCAVEINVSGDPSHSNDCVKITQLHDKISRVPTSISYDSV